MAALIIGSAWQSVRGNRVVAVRGAPVLSYGMNTEDINGRREPGRHQGTEPWKIVVELLRSLSVASVLAAVVSARLKLAVIATVVTAWK